MNHAALRWGILGTARIAREAVIPGIRRARNGTPGAVASRDRARARDFAEAQGIPRSYGSYEDLLADPDVDAVYIPLPNSEHREWTIRAAESGKHVLCEKPLGRTAAECMEMGGVGRDEARLGPDRVLRGFPPGGAGPGDGPGLGASGPATFSS